MVIEIERVTEGCVLGEAPHWDSDSQSLYFVDIFGKSILRYVPATKKINKASVGPIQSSFIIPVAEKKDHFLVSFGNELAVILWDGESESVTKVESICNIDAKLNSHFNDGKCDSSGRLWAGAHTLAEDVMKSEPLGTLYSLDAKRQLKGQADKIRISNGLAFNERAKKMYFIDSLGTLDQFDFDVTTGILSNKQVLFDLKKFNIPGILDGMTIDVDGNLWVAVFGGGKVLKIDGTTPNTLLETIDLPAIQVTSMIFGGKNFDELYVTTGACAVMGYENLLPPENGATYRITNTGSKGLPGYSFKLN